MRQTKKQIYAIMDEFYAKGYKFFQSSVWQTNGFYMLSLYVPWKKFGQLLGAYVDLYRTTDIDKVERMQRRLDNWCSLRYRHYRDLERK